VKRTCGVRGVGRCGTFGEPPPKPPLDAGEGPVGVSPSCGFRAVQTTAELVSPVLNRPKTVLGWSELL
jgi:hypothetical protein